MTQTGSERRMRFDPKMFREMITNNPDAEVTIVDTNGDEIRTFNTKVFYDLLYPNQSH